MTDAPEPAVPAVGERAAPRRPFALLALAGLLLVKAGLAVIFLIGLSVSIDSPILPGALRINQELTSLVRDSGVSQAVLIVLAALLATAAVGLIRLQRIGWVLAMVLSGLFVGLDIYAYIQGVANHLWMGLNLVTVFYLNQAEVREVVGVDPGPLLRPLEQS